MNLGEKKKIAERFFEKIPPRFLTFSKILAQTSAFAKKKFSPVAYFVFSSIKKDEK